MNCVGDLQIFRRKQQQCVLIRPSRRHVSPPDRRLSGVNEPPQLSAAVTFKAAFGQRMKKRDWEKKKAKKKRESAARTRSEVIKGSREGPFWEWEIKMVLLSHLPQSSEPFDVAPTGPSS